MKTFLLLLMLPLSAFSQQSPTNAAIPEEKQTLREKIAAYRPDYIAIAARNAEALRRVDEVIHRQNEAELLRAIQIQTDLLRQIRNDQIKNR